ncbi:MAG: dihydroorotase [Clostridia bacterium]|nr:dihydroorotase [Clostridia bacterium]
MRILIKGGRVIDPKTNTDKVSDVYIENGVIEEIGEDISKKFEDLAELTVIDAKGKVVSPGLVDMHCHLREPGQEYKEDIESGTKAAAMGGFTSIACMPNTNPPIDNAPIAEYVINRAAQVGKVNVYPIGAVTKGLKGEVLADIGELKFAGVVAISDDGRPVQNANIMRRALEYSDMFDTLVVSHCEELELLDGGVMNEGYMSTYLGLKGISNAVEDVQIARDIILAEETKTRVHICHVSTKGGVELVRQAKKRGVNVTCETCPHYFTLTEAAVEGFNTNAKMNPPLRTQEDLEAIIEGLCDGTIDVIATDHAPHHIDEKNLEFDKALNGIIGFETALGLGITYLVKTGKLTLSELIRKMALNPANLLSINKGIIAEGKPADIIIFNPDEEYKVDVKSFLSKSKNSPYDGYCLNGKVEYTIVGGKIVVNQGVML